MKNKKRIAAFLSFALVMSAMTLSGFNEKVQASTPTPGVIWSSVCTTYEPHQTPLPPTPTSYDEPMSTGHCVQPESTPFGTVAPISMMTTPPTKAPAPTSTPIEYIYSVQSPTVKGFIDTILGDATEQNALNYLNSLFGKVSAVCGENQITNMLPISWTIDNFSAEPGAVNRFSWKLAEATLSKYIGGTKQNVASGGTIEIANPNGTDCYNFVDNMTSVDAAVSSNAVVTEDKITFGKAVSDSACGVEVINPFFNNKNITAETMKDSLANSNVPLNAYIFRHTNAKDANGNPIATPEDTYYVASIPTVASAQAYDASLPGTQIVTTTAALEAYNGNWDASKDIKIMNMAWLKPGNESDQTVTFPYPTWNTGFTVSTWVKASTNQATPIFAFQNRNTASYGDQQYGGLAVYTDGTVVFSENLVKGKSNAIKCNNFYGQYNSEDAPTKHVGEWIYVTLSVKNDGMEVYFNGEKGSFTPAYNFQNNKTNVRFFNGSYGFPYTEGMTLNTRISRLVVDSCYTKRLVLFGLDISEAATGYASFKEACDDIIPQASLIMDYIASEDTKLYIGGSDIMSYAWWAENSFSTRTVSGEPTGYSGLEYTNAADGMEVANMKFNISPSSMKEAKYAYDEATASFDGEQIPTPTPTTDYCRGDVDYNGRINLTDANIVLRAALGIVTLTENEKEKADADCNNKIELTDANSVLKVALGITTL